jgi:hypoxanthine phosphoribosyltransferase
VTELGPEANGRETPSFAHASEAEMARILDFYDVRWEYEPTTFPILWNLEGEVVESFSPDFYLPELDMFLEMTTLKQRLVRKKNRKLRRLRELYPDIRIKLFYARDFAAMMLKYGRFALVESLSGTIGQMVPDRSGASAPILAAVPVPLAVSTVVSPVPPIAALPPVPAAVTVAGAVGDPVRRSRTAARRLRRRHLRAAASRAGVGAAIRHEGDHQASEATSE